MLRIPNVPMCMQKNDCDGCVAGWRASLIVLKKRAQNLQLGNRDKVVGNRAPELMWEGIPVWQIKRPHSSEPALPQSGILCPVLIAHLPP